MSGIKESKITMNGPGEKGEIAMKTTRKVEIFSAGCAVCEDTIGRVSALACPSCEIIVLDMKQPEIAKRARDLGIGAVPAVVIDGKLADCCAGRGPDERVLRAAGLGQPIT